MSYKQHFATIQLILSQSSDQQWRYPLSNTQRTEKKIICYYLQQYASKQLWKNKIWHSSSVPFSFSFCIWSLWYNHQIQEKKILFKNRLSSSYNIHSLIYRAWSRPMGISNRNIKPLYNHTLSIYVSARHYIEHPRSTEAEAESRSIVQTLSLTLTDCSQRITDFHSGNTVLYYSIEQEQSQSVALSMIATHERKQSE